MVPGDRQFLGLTRDGSGLTLLGARYYDETLGRFLSVDPLLDLADPQQWNGYAYANNNPVSFADPSGLLPLGSTDYSGVRRDRTERYTAAGVPPSGTVPAAPPATVAPPVSLEAVSAFSFQTMERWTDTSRFQSIYAAGNRNSWLMNAELGTAMDGQDGNVFAWIWLVILGGSMEGADAAHAVLEFRDAVKDQGVWDLKPYIRDEFGVEGGEYVTSIDGRTEVRADVFGNVNFGAMAALVGIEEEVAIRASNLSTNGTGVADPIDDAAISIGYRMVHSYPGGPTEEQYLEFILAGANGETIRRQPAE